MLLCKAEKGRQLVTSAFAAVSNRLPRGTDNLQQIYILLASNDLQLRCPFRLASVATAKSIARSTTGGISSSCTNKPT